MKKIKGIKNIIIIFFVIISLENCIKDNVTPLKNEGIKTYQLRESRENGIFLPVFTDIRNVSLFTIQRNFPSNADLNANSSISIKVNSALLTAYNEAHDESYELLPDSLFTLGSQVIKTGADYTLNFGQQDYIQSFDIKLNGQKFNLTKKYALPCVITTTDKTNFYTADTLKVSDTVIAFISLKNKYDNNYVANGYFYHPAAARTIENRSKIVSTAGPNSVIVELGDLGSSNYKALIVIDEVTNNLTITTAPGAGGGPYTMFTSGLPTTEPGFTAAWANSSKCNNTYDPATKTFYVRYGYKGGSGWRVTEEAIKSK